MKNRLISVICVISILSTCLSFVSGLASSTSDGIVNACFIPYSREIHVLTKLPEYQSVKMYVSGKEVSCQTFPRGIYTLLTTVGFVPESYGIVPVTIETNSKGGVHTYAENIEITKSFSAKLSLEENFNSIEPMSMSNTSDGTVVNAVNSLNNGQITLAAVPTSSYAGRYADITNTYTKDSSSALTMRFHSSADRGLPTLTLDPSSDGTNGIIELSYDFYTTNPYIRQTLNPVSRAYNSAMTFVTDNGTSYATSFRVVNFENYCFGSSDKTVEANKWYNIRFVTNLNDLTFEFYVDDELIDRGYFTYNDSRIGKYIYGIQKFNLAAGVQGKASANDKNPVNITFDNLRVTHTDTGASPYKLSHTTSDGTYYSDIRNATVSNNADSITVDFDNTLVCDTKDITLKTSDGKAVDADIELENGDAVSAKANRSSVIISPKSILSGDEIYNIVFSESVIYNSIAYGFPMTIPFKSEGVPSIVSPESGSSLELGNPIDIRAYTPDSVSSELYVDDEYITTLFADDKKCVSYSYPTSLEAAGEKVIKLVMTKSDGTTKTLTSVVTLSHSNIIDIIPLEKFDNGVEPDYFSIAKQASASSASVVQAEIDGRKAAAFYFVGGTGTNRKVIQVQKSVPVIQTGRVALEFDMYIAEANSKAELSISFGDGTYTFYPLDEAKQFSKGKIGGIEIPYFGWHRVKLVMDTYVQSSEIYFDGEKVGETCYTFDNTYHKSDVADPESITGFKAFTISLWQAQSYSEGVEYLGFAVDNWHVYREVSLPSINSISAGEKYFDGQLIPYDTTHFELEIANGGYVDSQSLKDNFSMKSDGKLLTVENMYYNEGKLSFDVVHLPQNAEIMFILGKNTVLNNEDNTIGTDVIFTLRTADANGLYLQKTVSVHDSETKVFFSFESIAETDVHAVVASYKYNKLISVTKQKITVKDSENTSLTVPNDGITDIKVFIMSGDNLAKPLTKATSASVGNSNPLGLKSVFEADSVALAYIGDAVVLKDDTDALVYNKKKYKYEDLTNHYPYKSTKGTFMIPADLFSEIFKVQITAKSNTVSVVGYGDTTVGSQVINAGENQIVLDSPFEIKNGALYVPVRSLAEDLLGKCYMYDRGMHIFDDEEFKYTNSDSTYETKEPIDSIYRLMQFEHKKSPDIYSMMKSNLGGNVHPRILTDKESIEQIKTNALTDSVVAGALENTIAEADAYITTPVQEYDIPDGVRLLVAARNVMERLVALSAAYLVTDNTEYADRAWIEIENCFAWPDWNTSKHYLDNSELLYGVAVAFDSFYDYYSDEQKKTILDKTWELSLSHTVDRYQGINFSGSEWRTARSNWGFVCNGAVVTAILAFGLEQDYRYQPYYDYLLECALQAIEYPLMLYYPDGAWEEGLAYWEYSLRYFVTSVLIPLHYSTGSTLDFIKAQGVDKIADMGLYMQSGNYAFNFSDNGSENKKPCESVYAFAMLTGNDELMQTWNCEMNSMNATHSARTLMWYRPAETGNQSSAVSLPLDSFFKGVEVGSMKQQWYNNNGSVVFFKGGQNSTATHLDTGTFCFDSLGKRWSVDPGKDSYNIKGGYNGTAGCELYVKRPEGHNCVVINPRPDVANEYYGGQYVNGRAEITEMKSSEKSAFSVVDLSDTYKYDTDSYVRGFYLGDNRRTLIVQDEIDLKENNSDIYWFMHTRASIKIDSDGKGAYLLSGTKRVRVDMLTNADNAKFVVNSVGPDIQRFPTDPIREGQLVGGSFTNIKVLTLEAKGSDNVYITVKLTPIGSSSEETKDIAYVPIEDWIVEY